MLDKLKISTRIAAGFGIVLALLLTVSVLGYTAVNGLGRLVNDYRQEVETTVAGADLRDAMRHAQFAIADFSTDPTEERGTALEAAVSELSRMRSEIFSRTGGDANQQIAIAVERFAEVAAAYRAAVAEAAARADRLTELGIAHRRGIGRLNAALEGREATELAYDALRASEMFLVTRVRIDRFLAGWPAEEFDTAEAPLQSTLAALDRIASGPLTAEERALARDERAGILAFRDAAAVARDAEMQRRSVAEAMEDVVTPLVNAVETAMAAAVADKAVLEADAEVRVATATRTIVAISAGAALLALLIATAIGWSVARATRGMVTGIDRMAQGDLDTAVAGGEAKTEIGAMARSLEVLRARGLEARRLEAEAEEMRRATAERQERELAQQTRVVSDISAGLERMAAGDLTTAIDSPAHDPFPAEYDGLRTAYNGALQRLGAALGRIGEVAGAVRNGSNEISAAAAELSSRAETQAATLEQSAAALNELNESVRSTAGRAEAAEQASRQNHTVAEKGRGVVREAVTAMQGIEKSSDQITRIIGVIDDIAFQTNLLALNAGVEAARAGEAGRGFAVVASEVRGLAQRATESAREIKGLIQESATQVETGSALVRRTGESLEEILRQAAQVSELMGEIAAAASEQAAGLDEVNTGVTQLDQVTQQNAAVAEETTASASALLQKAADLSEALAGFRTSGRHGNATGGEAFGGYTPSDDFPQPAIADWTESARAVLPDQASAPRKRAANAGWKDF